MLLKLFLSFTFCASLQAAIPVSPMTDLGTSGNKNVARKFANYKQAFENKGCQAQGTGRRVMLTGFGLFQGVSYNISGASVSSMGSVDFWPAETDLDNLSVPENLKAENGVLLPTGPGVKISNRSLKINNQNYEVCFITVNVNWDFAGAIFVDQATKFQPELVIMSGRASANLSLESGAVNNSDGFAGYDENGKLLDSSNVKTSNEPLTNGTKILTEYKASKTLPLTWNTSEVNRAIEAQVNELGYKISLPKSARRENNYICNNVSFIMANAITNRPTKLARGLIELESPNFAVTPKIGFMHFPDVDGHNPDIKKYNKQMFGWTTVLAKAIDSQLGN